MQGNRLDQARELLKKAERTTDPPLKKTQCERALEILDEIMENEPKEQEIIIINNIKKSFARSLVSQINTMNMNDIETTKFFYFNFIMKFPTEIVELMNEDQNFENNIKWLAEQFSSDLL
jgi:DNA polymerase III delta prime subunit